MDWADAKDQYSKKYTCSYCGAIVASKKGWFSTSTQSGTRLVAGVIYICSYCDNPTYFTEGNMQIPGVPFGAKVSGINEAGIENLYNEARRAYSASCFTSVVLCCRKLLMHLAVSKKAAQGLTFAEYVDFLDKNHFIPQGAHPWVDKIRLKGNEANHEIAVITQTEAENIISLSEMLLKILYEYPAKAK